MRGAAVRSSVPGLDLLTPDRARVLALVAPAMAIALLTLFSAGRSA